MTDEEILAIIAQTIEVDSVENSMELDEDVWDSLAVIIFIGTISNTYNKILEPAKIAEAKNAQQLIDLVKNS